MPRIRQNAEQDALKDFTGELNAQRARYGYSTYEEFGKKIGVCTKSAWNYIHNPGQIKMDSLRVIVKAIHPDPAVVLKALGYSTKDIKKLAKEYS